MTNLTMTRYPVYETYEGKGLSRSDIQSDLVMTVMRRFYQMTDQEREMYGITEDMITSNNLYRMIDEGRIKTTYWKTINGLPSYKIQMDLDGDELYSVLPNVASSEIGWIPEKPVARYNNVTYEQAKKEQKKKLRQWHLSKNPNPTDLNKAVWSIMEEILTGGKEALNEVGKDIDEFFGTNLQDDQEFLSQDIQENQQAIILLQSAMANRTDIDDINILKGNIVMNKDGRVVRSENAFFDLIIKNEGYDNKVYDAQKHWMNPQKHAKLMGEAYNLHQQGKFATQQEAFKSLLPHSYNEKYQMFDATVGHGFSMNNQNVVKALEAKGYTYDGLMSGKETIKMNDSIDIFLDTLLPEFQTQVRNTYGNIDFDNYKNSYLYLALTDMAYNAGSGFIGDKTQFYKHLNNYVATQDKAHLGEWGVADRKTVLGQMTIDANAYKAKGLSGIATRLEHNAHLITQWSNGASIGTDVPSDLWDVTKPTERKL